MLQDDRMRRLTSGTRDRLKSWVTLRYRVRSWVTLRDKVNGWVTQDKLGLGSLLLHLERSQFSRHRFPKERRCLHQVETLR